ARIGPLPDLQRVRGLVELAGNGSVVIPRDVKLFALAGAVAEFISLRRGQARGLVLPGVVVASRQSRIGDGKMRIQVERAAIERNGLRVLTAGVFQQPKRIVTKRF